VRAKINGTRCALKRCGGVQSSCAQKWRSSGAQHAQAKAAAAYTCLLMCMRYGMSGIENANRGEAPRDASSRKYLPKKAIGIKTRTPV